MPERYLGRLETSIFRLNGLSEARIWSLGHKWTVINPWPSRSGKRPIKGRSEITVSEINKVQPLYTTVDPSPHPRHGVILGWESEESAQMLAASKLVKKAIPHMI